MLRPLFSSALSLLILLSQVGLPLHYHFCKGSLESVSFFFQKSCDEEDVALANIPSCCKKFQQNHCKQKNNTCCHDKVKVISQEIQSVSPGFLTWSPATFDAPALNTISPEIAMQTIVVSVDLFDSDSGPPIYIKHRALIFYA